MKDKAADTADAAKHAAGDVAQTATDKAKDVAGEAQRQARDLVGEARDQLNGQASTQHRNLVNNLQSLADDLSRMANASEQPGLASDLVGQAGGRARGAAEWLGGREPGDLLGEVRAFARRRPGAFLVGALVAGVAAGRLTRGVVAAHTDVSEDGTATQTVPSANAAGYSSPPMQQGVPRIDQGSSYGGAAESGITSGMASSDVAPPGTFSRPSVPPAPAGPGSASS